MTILPPAVAELAHSHQLPDNVEAAYFRGNVIDKRRPPMRRWADIGDKDASPPVSPIIPIGKTAWWAGVNKNRYPQPIKLSPRVTVWRESEIYALVQK